MNASVGIGRLARVLSPSGRVLQDRVFALLAAYFDKSSDHPKGITSVAGYVATLDEWQNVEKAWEGGVRYWSKLEGFRQLGGFHMADLPKAIGSESASLCVKYFANIILESELHAIGAAIIDNHWHKPDWGDDTTPKLGSVYEQCLDLALRLLGTHTSERFQSRRVDVVFCRDDKHQRIDSTFYRQKQRFPMFTKQRVATGNDIMLLQCADLGAGCLRHRWRALVKGRLREVRDLPWDNLPTGKDGITRTAFWSLSQGEILRRELGVLTDKLGKLEWN